MGFSPPQHVYVSGTTGTSIVAVLGSNPTAGSVVCVSFFWYNGGAASAGAVTVQDGNSNSYTISPNSPSAARPATAGIVYNAYLIAPANADKTITISYTTASILKSASVDEFPVSGGTAAFDADAAGTGTTGTAINTPTIPVNGANELVYCAGVSDHNITSVDAPWTQVFAPGPAFSEAVGYILSRSSSVAVAMTENTSGGWDTIGMSFSFTAAGGTAPFVSTSTGKPVGLGAPRAAGSFAATGLSLTAIATTPVITQDQWRPQPAVRTSFGSFAGSLLQSTLAPVLAAAPFVSVAWPAPARPTYPPLSFASWFTIDDNAPFRPPLWLSPSLLARWIPPTTTQSLLSSTLAPPVASPFVSPLWPVPQQPGLPSTSSVWMARLALDQPPFVQRGWPVPLRAPWTPPTTTLELLQSTLTPAVAPKPFFHDPWPRPTPAYEPPHSWMWSSRPCILSIPASPFPTHYWPVPRRQYEHPHSFAANLQETTLAPVFNPGWAAFANQVVDIDSSRT